MIDETTDVTNQEQVTIIFRMVDNDLSVKEEFVGWVVHCGSHYISHSN